MSQMVVAKECPVHGVRYVRSGQTICGYAKQIGRRCSGCGSTTGKHVAKGCQGEFLPIFGPSCQATLSEGITYRQ